MESILQDIKTGKFNKIYLLYGEESYLRNSYRNKLRDAVVSPENSANISEFSGKNVNTNEIINAANTMPFFSERRVVVVSDANLFISAQDELSDFLSKVPDTTVMIFCEEKINKNFKLYKACTKYGRAVEFKKYNEDSPADMEKLKRQVNTIIVRNKKRITIAAMDLFLQRTGAELENIMNELEKLLCYTYDKDSITEDDVMAIVPERLEDKIYEMIDAMAMHDQGRALDLYYDLLRKKESPVRILSNIERNYNQLYIFKKIYEETHNRDEAMRAAKIPIYSTTIKKYQHLAGIYSGKTLEEAINMCLELDKAFKSGKIKDTVAVELIIVKMSGEAA